MGFLRFLYCKDDRVTCSTTKISEVEFCLLTLDESVLKIRLFTFTIIILEQYITFQLFQLLDKTDIFFPKIPVLFTEKGLGFSVGKRII